MEQLEVSVLFAIKAGQCPPLRPCVHVPAPGREGSWFGRSWSPPWGAGTDHPRGARPALPPPLGDRTVPRAGQQRIQGDLGPVLSVPAGSQLLPGGFGTSSLCPHWSQLPPGRFGTSPPCSDWFQLQPGGFGACSLCSHWSQLPPGQPKPLLAPIPHPSRASPGPWQQQSVHGFI